MLNLETSSTTQMGRTVPTQAGWSDSTTHTGWVGSARLYKSPSSHDPFGSPGLPDLFGLSGPSDPSWS